MLMDAHKETRKMVCSELLEQYENCGDDFLVRIFTGVEDWLHHFEPEAKRQSLCDYHLFGKPKESLRGTSLKMSPS